MGVITFENLRAFAYANTHLLTGAPRGIAVSFYGLGNTKTEAEDGEKAIRLAESGIVYLKPYLDPWAWMNDRAAAVTDEMLDVLAAHYGLSRPAVCSTGGSMGGFSALLFPAKTRHRVVRVVANCPVCDLPYHFTERPDLPRTLYAAYFDAPDFAAALAANSPYHLVGKLPRLPYDVFHCEEDRSVDIRQHSERFVAAMRAAGYDVRYVTVPGRGHCDLSPEAAEAYLTCIESAF